MKTDKTPSLNIEFESTNNQQVTNRSDAWLAQGLSTPWGSAIAAWVNNQQCVFFGITQDADAVRTRLDRLFGNTHFEKHPPAALCEALMHALSRSDSTQSFLLRGTDFQIAVWKALLEIPAGKTASYKHLAEKIERPKSARAVGQAVGANPIAWWVPCHRVLASSGKLGGYAWGLDSKKKMLEYEQRS